MLQRLRILITLFALLVTSFVSAYEAEVVWVEPGVDKNYILYSYFSNGEWVSPEEPIYETRGAVATPFLFNQPHKNKKTLMWTESRDSVESRIMAMSALISDEGGAPSWALPRVWYEKPVSNLAVTAIADLNNQAWYFWTHYDGQESQIYAVTPESSVAAAIHPSNDVPDYDAIPALTEDGRVSVSWYSFNKQLGDYDRLETTLGQAVDQKILQTEKPIDVTKISEIPIPSFLPNDQLIRIFFAANRKTPFIQVPR